MKSENNKRNSFSQSNGWWIPQMRMVPSTEWKSTAMLWLELIAVKVHTCHVKIVSFIDTSTFLIGRKSSLEVKLRRIDFKCKMPIKSSFTFNNTFVCKEKMQSECVVNNIWPLTVEIKILFISAKITTLFDPKVERQLSSWLFSADSCQRWRNHEHDLCVKHKRSAYKSSKSY